MNIKRTAVAGSSLAKPPMRRTLSFVVAATTVVIASLTGCSTLKEPQGSAGNLPWAMKDDPNPFHGFNPSPP